MRPNPSLLCGQRHNLQFTFFTSTFGCTGAFLLYPFWVNFLCFIPSGKLSNIFHSEFGFRVRVLACSLEKLTHSVFVFLYCCYYVWKCDSNLSCAIGLCHCRGVCFVFLHDQLLLACLTRYPVITSTLPPYFTLHAYSQHTHLHTFWLFLTSLSCRREEAEIREQEGRRNGQERESARPWKPVFYV